MAVIKAFECIRPDEKVADRVAALPYDVYNREEALNEVEREPLSFLAIDRAETQFDSSVDTYADCVYDKQGSFWIAELQMVHLLLIQIRHIMCMSLQ